MNKRWWILIERKTVNICPEEAKSDEFILTSKMTANVLDDRHQCHSKLCSESLNVILTWPSRLHRSFIFVFIHQSINQWIFLSIIYILKIYSYAEQYINFHSYFHLFISESFEHGSSNISYYQLFLFFLNNLNLIRIFLLFPFSFLIKNKVMFVRLSFKRWGTGLVGMRSYGLWRWLWLR